MGHLLSSIEERMASNCALASSSPAVKEKLSGKAIGEAGTEPTVGSILGSTLEGGVEEATSAAEDPSRLLRPAL